MIGIIGAMEIEVEEILHNLQEDQTEIWAGMEFHAGKISGVSCVVARCNPGKVNAACCTQIMILKYTPDAIINVGVAGGVSPQIKIGDLVLGSGAVQHDMDTTKLGDAAGYLSGLDLIMLPLSERLNKALEEAARETTDCSVHRGIIATGDQFIADASSLHRIGTVFHACACEMEAGSVAQVCYINSTECAVLRSISDHADSDACVDFVQFAIQAAQTAARLLCFALPRIAQ